MPNVNIQIERDGVSAEQRAVLIPGVADMPLRVMNESPAPTVVILDEVDTDDWGMAGKATTLLRREAAAQEFAASGSRP